jgi:hypothetical protein
LEVEKAVKQQSPLLERTKCVLGDSAEGQDDRKMTEQGGSNDNNNDDGGGANDRYK